VRSQLLLAIALLTGATGALAQRITLPLWPNGTPEPSSVSGPERDATKATDRPVAGRPVIRVTDVSHPSLSVYQPDSAKDTGAAVVVFPGGGYRILAIDLEGTEVCQWLNSIGMTCVLVKYRVPFDGHYPEKVEDLEDAQQAMRLTRAHAAEWHVDPQRVGALGFSAGGHLVVILGNHADFKREGAPETPESKLDARPNFVLVIYPGYLSDAPDLTKIGPAIGPSANTPPTFLLQAEDDPVHEENSLLYFQALKELKVPAELHIYAQGGHGYGLRPTELPVTHWPVLAETWLHTIHVLGAPRAH
jgi:acetyl esterase/lipase